MPPPKAVVRQSGYDLLTTPRSDIEAVEPLDQLVVRGKDGGLHHIRLSPNMTPASLRKKFDALGLRGERVELTVSWAEQHEHIYHDLIQAVFGLDFQAAYTMEAGTHPYRVRFEFNVNTHHFRAIAKIALHYYLLHTRLASGHEPGFQAMKRFIRWGCGHTEDFFVQNAVFVVPAEVYFTGVSSRWVHILGSCERNGEVLGYVRLFYGPRPCDTEYTLRLGRLSSRIILLGSAWAHAYLYDAPVPESGSVGQVDPLSLTRLR